MQTECSPAFIIFHSSNIFYIHIPFSLEMGYSTIYEGGKALDEKIIKKLLEIFPDGLSTKEEDKIIYSRDYWPIALRWFLDKKLPALPQAIVWPESKEQIASLIHLANEHGIPIIPYGGGSGVMGGAVPIHGGIVVDMKRMDKIVEVEDENLTVRVQTGINGMNLERKLNHHGYTLGHIPQSLYCSSLGGWLACKAAGQFSTKYGKIEDMVVALQAVLADGSVIESREVPRSSTGPEVEKLLIGSEGILGIITEATLKIWPYPEKREYLSFAFESMEDALEAVRKILRRNVYPAVVRIYDEEETLRHFYDVQEAEGKCMLILLMEGVEEVVELERNVAEKICKINGTPCGEKPVHHWLETRFNVKESSEFLPRGFIFDTVEISAPWKNSAMLYHSIIKALKSVKGMVIASAHASHFYPQGVCFYFTFGGIPPKGMEAYDFYISAWDAIMDECIKNKASISHHHGIGITRKKWLAKEMRERMKMLKKIKEAIDPNNIMNPGKLVVEDE